MTFIAYEGGLFRCYTTPDGIRRKYVGCRHEKPRQAIDHASPVRSESPSYPRSAAGYALGGGLSEVPAAAASLSTAGASPAVVAPSDRGDQLGL